MSRPTLAGLHRDSRGNARGAPALLFVLLGISLVALLCASRGPVAPCDSIPGGRASAPVLPESASSELRLGINVPAYRLDVFERGALTRSYGVAVGAPKYSTPRGVFVITELEWNPWWIPPPAEWAKNDSITPPGPANPMGRVKLYFRPTYFVHGTPVEKSIGSAVSHGCIRMRNVDAIALGRLVSHYGAPHVGENEIDSLLVDFDRTSRVALSTPVQLDIRYDIAEVRGDSLYVYRDIYGLMNGRTLQLAAATAAAALEIDSSAVRLAPLRAAVRGARRGRAVLSLADLR